MRNRSVLLDAGLRGQVGQLLERRDELRPAVGIAGVVDRVHADEQVGRAHHFSIAERQRQKHRVAGRHVGDRECRATSRSSLRSSGTSISSVSALPPNSIEPDRRDDVPLDAQRLGHAPRRIQLEPMPLAVVDRQRKQPIPFRAGNRRRRGRIEPAGKQDDGGAIVGLILMMAFDGNPNFGLRIADCGCNP